MYKRQAFVRPLVFPEEYGGNRQIIARLIARYLIDSSYEVPEVVSQLFGEVFKAFGMALKAKHPNMDSEKIQEYLLFSSGAALHMQTFGSLAAQTQGSDLNINYEQLLKNLTKFSAQGLMA